MLKRNAVLFCSTLFVGISCSSGDESDLPTIAIGAVLDQSGSVAAPSWNSSVSVAIDHLNAGLSGAGASFRLRAALADSTGNGDVTAQRAASLVKNEGVVGLVTDLSGSSINTNALLNYATQTTERLNVPGICILCTSPAINNPTATDSDPTKQAAKQDPDGWWQRTSTNQDVIADLVFNSIFTAGADDDGDVNGDDILRVTIYLNDDDPGRNFRIKLGDALAAHEAAVKISKPDFKTELEAVFIAVDQNGQVDIDTHPWSADLVALTDSVNSDPDTLDKTPATAPDAILESATAAHTIALIKLFAAGSYTVPFYHFHGFRHPLTALSLGNAINGQEGLSHILLDNGAAGTVFAAALHAKTGLGPQYLDSSAYDAAVVLGLAAIAAASGLEDPTAVTGTQVRDAISMTQTGNQVIYTGPAEFTKSIKLLLDGTAINYEGASGPVDFDANGNALGKIAHYTGTNGTWVESEIYDCAQPGCPLITQ